MNVLKTLFCSLAFVASVNATDPAVPAVPPVAQQPATVLINLNTADEATLSSLTGVGPKKAKDIIEYRKANNGFKTIEEFSKVHGIGPKTFETNRARLTVGDVKAPAKPADAKPELKPMDSKPSAPGTPNGLTPKM